ncbi:MAG: VOC family protein [Anaerolineae bacterium]|nr:VOC family protein [Anaerolineae bacterium]
MTLSTAISIANVHLQVSDLTRSLGFYQNALGLQVLRAEGQTAWLSANGEPPHLLQISALPNALPRPPRTSGLFHVAFRLPDRLALARLFYRLVALEVPFQGFADHAVSEALYLADPDGNGLELYRDRPRADWPFTNGQVQMTTDPLDVDRLLHEGTHSLETSHRIDPETDIGHIHLQVGDLERAERFYVDLIGMEVMQRSYPGALFIATDGYHHHIGLNIWAGRNVPPAPENTVGLRHFSIAIPDADAWRAKLNKMQTAGRTIKRLDEIDQESFAVKDDDNIEVRLVYRPTPP